VKFGIWCAASATLVAVKHRVVEPINKVKMHHVVIAVAADRGGRGGRGGEGRRRVLKKKKLKILSYFISILYFS
jgi:hypothetical protein